MIRLLISRVIVVVLFGVQKLAFTDGKTVLPPPLPNCQDTIYAEISAYPHTPYTPPVLNDDSMFVVNITMYLIDLLELTEKDETVTTSWIAEAQWTDPRLRWNPADHNMCSGVSLPSSAIYLPDFRIFNDNSEDFPSKLFDNSFRVMVDSSGGVDWWTAGIVTSGCNMNVKYFPFDTQICHIHIESATLDITTMLLHADGNASLNLDKLADNNQWDIVSYDVVPGNRLGGSNIKYYLNLKRKPEYYLFNIVAPTVILSIMSVVVFILPAHAEEKMGLAVTILLAFTVFMLTISNALPPSSDEISVLGLYTFVEMAMAALAVLASVGILNIEHMPHHLEPSRGFRLFCAGLCRPLCMTNLYRHRIDDVRAASPNQVAPEDDGDKKHESGHQDQGYNSEKANYKEEYAFYALVIDRALFWLFLFFQLVLMVAALGIYPAYQPDYSFSKAD